MLAAVVSTIAAGPNTPTATGAGLTWVQVATVAYSGASTRRLTVFRAAGASPSAGAVTFDFAGQTQGSFAWSIIQFAGADEGGTNGSAAVVQSTTNTAVTTTSITATLAALENSANMAVVFVGRDLNSAITPDANFTEISDVLVNNGPLSLESEVALGRTSATATYTSSTAGSIAVEIKSASL